MAFSYVMIGSNDMERSRKYYDAVIPVIGGIFEVEYPGQAICYKLRDEGRVWIVPPYNKEAAEPGNGIMIGFGADSAEMVQAAHAAALSSGGSNEGDPGPRPQYGPNVYGAYARDPEGNKMSFFAEI